ncbi:MAG TPA: hypothetical protein VMW17_22390 [Candidatus Binatia bacterium]|nr:hypothetical protein [Candidatus Binatia bacterium]
MKLSVCSVLALAFVAAIGLAIAGCGGGGSDPFALCGNGRLDPGEQCDDGNLRDDDGCLSTCVIARCGDGFVYSGVETCDGKDFAGQSCASFGFAAGTLRCSTSCQVDASGCSVPFTPTPPPPNTPTPTATPSPTPLRCGNGVIEPGETCDTCPADCVVRTCSASTPMHTVAVSFTPPVGQVVSGLTVLVGYRSDVVSLPGSGSDSSVSSRIKNRPSNAIFSAFDLDYALRAVMSRSGGLTPGQVFTINFDGCAGMSGPTLDDFGCTVEGCANQFGDVPDCQCSITIP